MKKEIKFKIPVWFWPSLAAVFVVLKLVGVITWSWVWVLGPLWIPIALYLSLVILTVFIACLISLFK